MDSLPPIADSMTGVIATRELQRWRGDEATPLRIEIGQPVQDVVTAGGTDWRCPVRWTEDGVARIHVACGVDSFQALQLSQEWVRHALVALAAEPDTRLEFLDVPYDACTQMPVVRALRGPREGDSAGA